MEDFYLLFDILQKNCFEIHTQFKCIICIFFMHQGYLLTNNWSLVTDSFWGLKIVEVGFACLFHTWLGLELVSMLKGPNKLSNVVDFFGTFVFCAVTMQNSIVLSRSLLSSNGMIHQSNCPRSPQQGIVEGKHCGLLNRIWFK